MGESPFPITAQDSTNVVGWKLYLIIFASVAQAFVFRPRLVSRLRTGAVATRSKFEIDHRALCAAPGWQIMCGAHMTVKLCFVRSARIMALQSWIPKSRIWWERLASRISAVALLVEALSMSEKRQLGHLVRAVLSRQETSELDRLTICRMCDNGHCTNCPLPTRKSKRDT